MEVLGMLYKIKFKKSVAVATDKGRKVTFAKGTTAKVMQTPKKAWKVQLPGGETAKVERKAFSLKKQYTDHATKYTAAVAEDWINKRGTASDTKFLLWASKRTQRIFVFQGKAGAWKLLKRFNCTTGSITHGQGSDTKVSFSYKVYDKEQRFSGPYGTQVRNMHFSSPHGNSIHYRSGAKEGIPKTHGCIGLAKTGSIWIYDHIPVGTRVVVY